MGSRVAAVALSIVALLGCASAGAMTSGPAAPRCRVTAGDKLLAAVGGTSGICEPIEKAVASAAPGVPYSVDVSVLTRARLSAKLAVNGRTLPDQNFAVMDGELSRASIERFAQSLAAEVAKAAKP